MKKTTTQSFRALVFAVTAFLFAEAAFAADQPQPESLPAGIEMFVVERNMPDLGAMKPEDVSRA